MKKMDKDNLIAGIIALVAFVAIICELLFGGISTTSIAAAVKDTAGIFVDIMVFLLAFKVFSKKKESSVRGEIENAMIKIEKSYEPLIREHQAKETNQSDKNKNEEFIRYDLAEKVEALFGVECNSYMRFFELKSNDPEYITFYIRKKFFGEGFDPEKIAKDIKGFCDRKYNQFLTTYSLDKDGANITLSFNKVLETTEDFDLLTSVVDDVLLLYIAKNKK